MPNTDNPIDQEERLRELLDNIGNVKSRKAYGSWRKEFLELYTDALDENGVLNGKDGNYRLIKQLQQLEHRAKLVVDGPLKQGSVSNSANGRRLLTNLTQEVAKTETKVQELLPKTEADVVKFGFDKFELAAVLLEDAFYGYDKMKASRQTLDAIADALVEFKEDGEFRNELSILRKYSDAVESFVKVMEDLKLVTIMEQCVDVVYKGKERPEPKPPPVPSNSDEDESESNRKKKPSRRKSTKKKPSSRAPSSDDEDDDDDAEVGSDGKPEKKKKKKKGKEKEASSRNLAGKPKKKKKPKKKGGGDDPAGSDDDDDDDATTIDSGCENGGSDAPPRRGKNGRKKAKRSSVASKADGPSSKPKSSRSSSKKKPSASSRSLSTEHDEDHDDENEDGPRKQRNDEEDPESSSSSDDEDDEDEEGEEGPPPESEFLLYYDPKTNSIGRIDRKESIAKSSLLVETKGDDGHGGDENYKNVIADQGEKDDVWFMLKKLEKQKPEETSWLDEIKKEKEAAKKAAAAAAADNNNNDGGSKKKKVNKSTARISKRNLMSPVKSPKPKTNGKGLGVGTSMIGSGGSYRSPLEGRSNKKVDVETVSFRNPLAEASGGDADSDGPKSPTKKKPSSSRRLLSPPPNKTSGGSSKTNVVDYRARYQQIADKPDADGWTNMSSRALQ